MFECRSQQPPEPILEETRAMADDSRVGWSDWERKDRPSEGYAGPLVEAREDLRSWALAIWGLYLLAAVTAGTVAILGVIAAYVKRRDARGTIWESHFDNQIRTFWISLLLFVVAFPLALILVGWLVWGVMLVYYLWKSVKGTVRAVDRRPY
jgi:uncharacterized membrane protein